MRPANAGEPATVRSNMQVMISWPDSAATYQQVRKPISVVFTSSPTKPAVRRLAINQSTTGLDPNLILLRPWTIRPSRFPAYRHAPLRVSQPAGLATFQGASLLVVAARCSLALPQILDACMRPIRPSQWYCPDALSAQTSFRVRPEEMSN